MSGFPRLFLFYRVCRCFSVRGSSKTPHKKSTKNLTLVLFRPLTHPPTTGFIDFFGRPLVPCTTCGHSASYLGGHAVIFFLRVLIVFLAVSLYEELKKHHKNLQKTQKIKNLKKQKAAGTYYVTWVRPPPPLRRPLPLVLCVYYVLYRPALPPLTSSSSLKIGSPGPW
jgi:hypothetical protein